MTNETRELVLRSASPDDTLRIGRDLGTSLVGDLVIGLVGELGAGKTQFVKGMAAGNALGDTRAVTSPTFTLVHEYKGRLHLYHADVYRLRDAAELAALGFDEWVRSDAVVVVEWADRVREVMPDDTLWVEIRSSGATSREITLRATAGAGVECLVRLRAD